MAWSQSVTLILDLMETLEVPNIILIQRDLGHDIVLSKLFIRPMLNLSCFFYQLEVCENITKFLRHCGMDTLLLYDGVCL